MCGGFAETLAPFRRVPGRPDRHWPADRVGASRDRRHIRSSRSRRGARDQRDHGQRAAARSPSGDALAAGATKRICRARASRVRAGAYYRDRCARSRGGVGRSQSEGSKNRRTRPLDRRHGAGARVRRRNGRPYGLRPSSRTARAGTSSLARRMHGASRRPGRNHRARLVRRDRLEALKPRHREKERHHTPTSSPARSGQARPTRGVPTRSGRLPGRRSARRGTPSPDQARCGVVDRASPSQEQRCAALAREPAGQLRDRAPPGCLAGEPLLPVEEDATLRQRGAQPRT